MNALTAKNAERMQRVSKLAGKALWQNKLSQIKINSQSFLLESCPL